MRQLVRDGGDDAGLPVVVAEDPMPAMPRSADIAPSAATISGAREHAAVLEAELAIAGSAV